MMKCGVAGGRGGSAGMRQCVSEKVGRRGAAGLRERGGAVAARMSTRVWKLIGKEVTNLFLAKTSSVRGLLHLIGLLSCVC
jgi:hypothetical protein